MIEENTYFTYQLSSLEGYPLTLCGVTSRIKADRLSISVQCQIGVLYTPSSCFGVAKNCFEYKETDKVVYMLLSGRIMIV